MNMKIFPLDYIDTINGTSQWFVDTSSTEYIGKEKDVLGGTNDSSVSWSIAE